METNSGVTVIGAEAPSAYQMAPRAENGNQIGGGSSTMEASSVSVGLTGSSEKKKRGRPRKYGPDGSVARTLSPMPISSSIPAGGGEFSSGGKPGRGRGSGYQIKQQKGFEMENLGERGASSGGTNFMPHIMNVNAGEDVTMKIISFSQEGPRAISILSANGVLSNVTLRQPDSLGGTLTYEGCFEILSLSGFFLPTDTQGSRSRSGGMSISLSGPDGRVVGGGVAGLLIAASPVQVVVASFIPSNQHDHKTKKQQKNESAPATVAPNPPIVPAPVSNAEQEDGMDGILHQNSNALKPNLTAATFHGENWAAVQEPRNSATDINISLPV